MRQRPPANPQKAPYLCICGYHGLRHRVAIHDRRRPTTSAYARVSYHYPLVNKPAFPSLPKNEPSHHGNCVHDRSKEQPVAHSFPLPRYPQSPLLLLMCDSLSSPSGFFFLLAFFARFRHCLLLGQESEDTSHHPMARKHLPCRAIQRCRSEPCIDRGVLDIRMSQPILHKRQISTGIKQVRRN